MFTDQLREAAASAPLRELDAVSRAVWRGLAEGILSDDEAQSLAEIMHARRNAVSRPLESHGRPPSFGRYPTARKPQRPPAPSQSLLRRRRLAASGPLPPALACRFTVAELAVLRIVGDEVSRGKLCTLCIDALAARSGTSRSTVKRALAQARRLGIITVEERRRRGLPSLTNVVTVVSREWLAWLERRGRGPRSGYHGQQDIDQGASSRWKPKRAAGGEQGARAAQGEKRWRSGRRA